MYDVAVYESGDASSKLGTRIRVSPLTTGSWNNWKEAQFDGLWNWLVNQIDLLEEVAWGWVSIAFRREFDGTNRILWKIKITAIFDF